VSILIYWSVAEFFIATYQNTTLIYNPRAGRVIGNPGLIPGILRALRENGLPAVEVPTTGPLTAGAIARDRIAAGSDLILVAGGDGTVNETVEGMVHSPVPLGVIPAGTANVFAHEVGLAKNVEKAARDLANLEPVRISLGVRRAPSLPAKHFLLMAGAGLDAYIVYNVNTNLKARVGKVAYWLAGFGQVGKRLQEFDVTIDGRTSRASFGLFSRVRNYGGDLEIARDVSLLDDSFEVVLFEGPSSLRYLHYFSGVLLNRLPHIKGAKILRATKIELSKLPGAKTWLQIDGETAGELPATLEIVPRALTLLLPRRYIEQSRKAKR
jgi:diacylglycerol kinase (ATP)